MVPKKKRGPPATGKGTQIQVRLQPELLSVVDQLAREVGTSRPDALRFALAQWAEANGKMKSPDRIPERKVMLSINKSVLALLDDISGGKPYDEVIDVAISRWIELVKREDG